MPTKEYYIEQIKKEFAAARKALQEGNDGKARVCARRAAGKALTWFVSKYPRPGWRTDAMSQLNNMKSDPFFPADVRDAAIRLLTKVTGQSAGPYSTDPIGDGDLIVKYIKQVMESDAA
jgi:hypothetical protein